MKKLLRRLLFFLGALALLLALFHLVENFRGRRAWLAWKRAQEAAGQRYDLEAYIPKQIPDADNFATAPIVAGALSGRDPGSPWALPGTFTNSPSAGDWRAGQPADYGAFARELKGQSLEDFLKPFEAQLDAIAEAARRPGSRLQLDYSDLDGFPPLLGMRARARVLRLRALAWLQSGRSEAALEDVLTGLRIARHFQHEPHLISQLLHVAQVNIFMQPVWEGLRARAWNEGQLARLQAALEPIDLIAAMNLGWQFERCGSALRWSRMAEGATVGFNLGLSDATQPQSRFSRWSWGLLLPKGWVYQNLLTMDRNLQEQFGMVLDAPRHVVHARVHRDLAARRAARSRTPYTWLGSFAMPALAPQNLRVARSQSGLDLARIACALERHRLAVGAYPENLDSLVPKLLPKVPHDVVDAVPLRYRREGNAFRLYSLGWNGSDEGGQIADGNPATNLQQGDWVWSTGK